MSSMLPLTAALADRYRIERELGAGGMATVYLAEDLKHRRRVAIKVLRPELAQLLGAERFLREIEVIAGLHHPHILPLYDSGEAAGFLYYVMPLVEGESLRAKIDREGQLPIDEALRYAREVADALSYAHAHGVVHRDIKPDNIMIESDHAIVADFGIAKAVASAGDATALTGTGMSVGTPAYMSPEQAAGDREVDGRSDLYSLGCVLFEMLAGQPPFTGKTIEIMVRQHIMTPPPPVTQFRPAVPAPVADALARALAKAPADRFNPVGQFSSALVSGGSQPTTGITPTNSQPDQALGRTWRSRSILITVTVILLLGALAWLIRSRPSAVPLATTDSTPSIAVLPFTELAAPEGQEYFADGLTDEVITRLSQIPGLRVPGRASSFYFKGTKADLRAIAESLHVGSLLTATIQRSADRVRVRAQLINAADGFQRWSATYDQRLEDLFAVYDDVARGITEALQVTLAGDVGTSTKPSSRVRPDAYDAFLIGGQYLAARRIDSALPLLHKAVELEPGFAAGWSALAFAHMFSTPAQYGIPGVTGEAGLRAARLAVNQALALDSLSAEAHTAAGFLAYLERRWQDAQRQLTRAIELNPNYPPAHHHYAILLMTLGDGRGAVAEERKAQAMDPLSVIVGDWVGLLLWASGQHQLALQEFDRLMALHPTSSRIWSDAGLLHVRTGNFARAALLYERAALLMFGDSAIARRWRAGMSDVASRMQIAGEIADSIPRGEYDLLAYTGNMPAARRGMVQQGVKPGEMGSDESVIWITHPELRQFPEYQRLVASLRLPTEP
jgi:serine/threonine protein kinase/tetratricopeptide (TPR) repeat protein